MWKVLGSQTNLYHRTLHRCFNLESKVVGHRTRCKQWKSEWRGCAWGSFYASILTKMSSWLIDSYCTVYGIDLTSSSKYMSMCTKKGHQAQPHLSDMCDKEYDVAGNAWSHMSSKPKLTYNCCIILRDKRGICKHISQLVQHRTCFKC